MNSKKIQRLAAVLVLSAAMTVPCAGQKAAYAEEMVVTDVAAGDTETSVSTEEDNTAADTETTDAETADTDTADTGTTDAEAAEKEAEPELTEMEKKWADRVMVTVDDHLNVRAEASADSEIVGRMYPNTVAAVIKQGDEWTKIRSGKVKGYIKTSYCLFGMDAYKNFKNVCFKSATVTSTTLNIRSKANTDSSILKTVDKGTTLRFLKNSGDEWVKVKSGKVTGFVYKKYVDIGYNTEDAQTIKQIEAQKKAEKEAEEKAKNAYSATDEEIDLLAALIECEAGSEPYDGMVAVGAVVLNRVKSSSYSNTISGVIYEPYQFGPARSGLLAKALNSSIPTSCINAAKEALSGTDPTGGLLHFNRNNGTGKLVIGHQMFY